MKKKCVYGSHRGWGSPLEGYHAIYTENRQTKVGPFCFWDTWCFYMFQLNDGRWLDKICKDSKSIVIVPVCTAIIIWQLVSLLINRVKLRFFNRFFVLIQLGSPKMSDLAPLPVISFQLALSSCLKYHAHSIRVELVGETAKIYLQEENTIILLVVQTVCTKLLWHEYSLALWNP